MYLDLSHAWLQACWRGHQGRKLAAAAWQELDLEFAECYRINRAIVLIQRVWRRHDSQRRAYHAAAEIAASLIIQRVWRRKFHSMRASSEWDSRYHPLQRQNSAGSGGGRRRRRPASAGSSSQRTHSSQQSGRLSARQVGHSERRRRASDHARGHSAGATSATTQSALETELGLANLAAEQQVMRASKM